MTSPTPVMSSDEVEDREVTISVIMVKNLSVLRNGLRRCRVPRRYNQFSKGAGVSKSVVWDCGYVRTTTHSRT